MVGPSEIYDKRSPQTIAGSGPLCKFEIPLNQIYMSNLSPSSEEVWVDIAGFEGSYQISTLARVKSLPRTIVYSNGALKKVKGRIRKQKLTKEGYYIVNLCRNSKNEFYFIHRLVAHAFVPNPNNLPEVNHKNRIKTDCSPSNLEWCTTQFNIKHGFETDVVPRKRAYDIFHGKANPRTRGVIQILPTGEKKKWVCIKEAANELKIGYSTILKALAKTDYKPFGCSWVYDEAYVKEDTIVQKTVDGKVVRTWPSIKDAADALSASATAISNCIHGRYKTSYGFVWEKLKST